MYNNVLQYRQMKEVSKMYVIDMKITSQYAQGEYVFHSKKETQEFLEGLNEYQLDCIISITKYNKSSFRSAWFDFFN